jgi:DNA-binding XRE family transcriptional regulator
MLEPTKKRPTKTKRETSASVAEAIPWRQAFPGLTEDQIPGRTLRGLRGREGFTQKQLADITGISLKKISEMERGRRLIDQECASVLAQALKAPKTLFQIQP